MIYTSPAYLVFFSLVLFCFLFLPIARRAPFLLAASLFFYAWTSYLDTAIFLFVVLFIWLAVELRAPLAVGIGILVLHLGFWKYFPWLAEIPKSEWPFALPLGISFITLQGIAYLVDHRQGKADRLSFAELLLFKAFFAQLIAGPITRARQLVPQLRTLNGPSDRDAVWGGALFVQGFIKKVWIADALAPFVDQVFARPAEYSAGTLLAGAFAYALQIWGDFSGYTDMGLGSARMLGITLPENFYAPYFASSLRDFWRRWHQTLSTWIRDYIYIPLGGNRGGKFRQAAVLLFTFTLSGLWHGANLNFILWGFLHGVLLLIERHLSFLSPYFSRYFRTALTFVLVLFGWILFRAPTWLALQQYLAGLFSPLGGTVVPIGILGVPLVLATGFHLQPRLPAILSDWSERRKISARRLCLGLGLITAVLFLFRPQANLAPFIYFQF